MHQIPHSSRYHQPSQKPEKQQFEYIMKKEKGKSTIMYPAFDGWLIVLVIA